MNSEERKKYWAGKIKVAREAYVIQNVLPYGEWPVWAKALKQLAITNDKGIGDVAARIIGDERSAKFKAWHLATFGKACGCNGRQALWNSLYPLT